MIVTKTPLRISFVGGGSDLPSFYKKSKGAVISSSIDKYMYIAVNKKFDSKIRVAYSITEIVESAKDLKHELVKEALKYFGIKNGIEIASISDIPSEGTGLGSSSSYIVGLINALSLYLNKPLSKSQIAKIACDIEITKCKKIIGKQDQYAASFGGLNYIEFIKTGEVTVSSINLSKPKLRLLNSRLLMFYTGMSRSAHDILKNQSKNIVSDLDKFRTLQKMVSLAGRLKDELSKSRIDSFGEALHENWIEKKKLSSAISNPKIDEWYDLAINAGALGGKVLGAGGGGFLLFYVPDNKQKLVIKALKEIKLFPVNFESDGTIIYDQK